MKIGYSLPACVADIHKGRVLLPDVEKIVVEVVARTEAHWEYAMFWFCRSAWKGYETEAVKIVHELRKSGRIEMPRLENPDYYPPSGVVWTMVDEDPTVVPQPPRRLRAGRWDWRA